MRLIVLSGITKGQKASGSGSSSLIQKGVENIKLADEKAAAPKIVRKKIDVLAEYESSKDKQKENANLVVIGTLIHHIAPHTR